MTSEFNGSLAIALGASDTVIGLCTKPAIARTQGNAAAPVLYAFGL
jgi:hypothetical protein